MKRDLRALAAREHDVLVVGGGIHGAAVAWDAAMRGLTVALVEAEDFGAGVSWNSLKTIHGGLRHLQRGEVGLLRRSAAERRAFLRIAPGLVRPLPFLVPTFGRGTKGREAFAAALRINDLLTLDRNHGLPPAQHIPPGRVLGPHEVRARVPGLDPPGMNGGALWHDAQVVSSERLLLAFLHAAADAGAVVANRVEATGFLRCGKRVPGVRARDRETGDGLEVRARCTVNAAGPAVDALLAGAGVARDPVPLLKAVNLVFARPAGTEVAVGARSGGRFLFLVPWRDRTIVGTDYAPPGADPTAQSVAFLAEAQRAFPWAGLREEEVAVVHRGLVPGRDARRLWTRHRLLDHEAEDDLAGLVSIVGVKYTGARAVAEEVVDLVCARLGRGVVCRTAETPLPAAVLPDGPLADQARRAVREEMALHLGDVVLRRLELGAGGPPPPDTLEQVTRLVATERGWDARQLAQEKSTLAQAWARPPGPASTMDAALSGMR